MTVYELIKKAIEDQELRAKLLNDAIATCKEFEISVEMFHPELSTLNLKSDPSVLQGGYRP
jgi:hypothetical protein